MDKLKHLLRQAAELTVPPSQPEVESLQSQVSSLQSPAGQLNAALGLRMQSTPQTPPLGLAAPQTGARHQGASLVVDNQVHRTKGARRALIVQSGLRPACLRSSIGSPA